MLRERLRQHLLQAEREQQAEKIALYQSTIRMLQSQLQQSQSEVLDLTRNVVELQERVEECLHQQSESMIEHMVIQERLQRLHQNLPAPIVLGVRLCSTSGCTSVSYQGERCFEHFRAYWLSGGDSL